MVESKTPKRYFWLKLQSTYFSQLEQKKMRKQDYGRDIQIIYLRMMLYSIDKGGYIYYQGVYDSLEEELAEEFDEPIEVIKIAMEYLKKNSLVTISDESDCFIPEALDHTGSECYSAERVRRHRESKKTLQCYTDVSQCNEEIELEKETDLEKEVEKTDCQQIADMYNNTCVSFPHITKLSEGRKKAIKARLKVYSAEDFQMLFNMAERSSFLKGQNNRDWTATFDWLIKDSNMAKVLDGNYADKCGAEKTGQYNPLKDISEETRIGVLKAAGLYEEGMG